MTWKRLALIPLVLAGFTLFVTAGGFIVQQLWNWLLPPLFGWHAVTFWQALGLLALCRLLFGGFGMQGGAGPRLRDRWSGKSPEDRERFRQRMRDRFGCDLPAGKSRGE